MCINDSVKRCWWHADVGDSKWAPVSEFLMTQFWSSWQNRHQHFSSSTSTIHINVVSIIRISVTNVNEKFGIFLHCLNKLVTESIKYITKIENRIFTTMLETKCVKESKMLWTVLTILVTTIRNKCRQHRNSVTKIHKWSSTLSHRHHF